MFKRVLTLGLAAVMSFTVLTGCSSSSDKDAGGENGEGKDSGKIQISIQAVPTDNHAKAMETFKNEIEKNTDGKVTVELHHSGALMSQDAELPAIMKGSLDVAQVSANQVADYIPSLSFLTMGYLFDNYDHMWNTFTGEVGDEIFNTVADEMEILPLAPLYLGARQINLRNEEGVTKPEDLKGVKLRMPNTESWLFLGESLGATPTPLAFSELYLALKTGTVDGQDNPIPTVYNAKFYEVTKSLSLTNHSFDTTWITINKKTFDSFNEETQSVIKEAAITAAEECGASNQQAEQDLLKEIEAAGLNIVEVDQEAFKKYSQEKYLNDERSKEWNMDLYQKVQDLSK